MKLSSQQSTRVSLLVMAFALITSQAARANVIHVPADRPTIQAAINTAANGDTVLVAPGTYQENINFMGKAITVTSSGGAQVTIIDGGKNGSVVTFSTGEGLSSVLSGFTIQNGFANFQGGGISVNSASPTILNNNIVHNSGCEGAGIAIEFSSAQIKGNTISNNVQGGCSGGTGGGGINIGGIANAQIIGNVIDHNTIGVEGGGIGMFAAGAPIIRSNTIVGNIAGTSGGGISMVNQSDANIIQNLITGNSAPQGGGLYWLVPSGDRGPLLVNNTIAGNESANGSGIFGDGFQSQANMVNNLIIGKNGQIAVFCGNFNNTTPPIFTFDDVFSLGGTGYAGICTSQTGTNGNISADPLFVNPPSNDYHLRVGSPAIDVGDNSAPNLPPKDIDGDNRIINATGLSIAIIDMGVDEFSKTQVLTLSSSALVFAGQPVFTTSPSQSVTFANDGPVAINISAVISAGDFSQSNNCGTSLATGASCTVKVTFTPTARGLMGGVLAIMTDASESPQAVVLSGTGTGPVVSLSTTLVSFSAQEIGTTSAAQAVVLTNTGDGPLTLTSIVVNGDFAIASTGTACSTSTPVEAGANCTINVTFTPIATGTRTGAVTITDNAQGSPHSIQLSGLGSTPATIAAAGGTPQSTATSKAFASPLLAMVRDAGGNPVSGVTVTFTAPASGPSGMFAGGVNTAVTNASGMATSATFLANAIAGSYTVVATAGAVGPANFNLTNTTPPVATITATGGTPQSAVVNTAFASPLLATVKDAGGNPVSGVTVMFMAPDTRASGKFAGGLSVNTAVTDASGVATSSAFTANNIVGGPYAITASVAGAATTASFSLTNTAGAPATITAIGGTPQSAVVNTALASPLLATVKDAGGNPVSGVVVTFTVPGSGAGGTFAGGMNAAVTNASGVATSATFTANAIAGSYTVVATAGAVGPANFSLANTTTAPATITATGGTPQNTVVNAAFASPLQATVKDAGGNPVSGVTVTFTAPASRVSGTFAGGVTTAVTNAGGVATSVAFTANGTVGGPYTVTASVAGAATTASFSLTNTAGAPATITAIGGTPQSAAVNTAFALPLQATVKDAGGNPVPGVTVTFTFPASGASGTFAGGMNTAVTNTSGVATSAALTANGTPGGPYNVTAMVGAVGPADFSLMNTTTAPVMIKALAGTPQSAVVNTAFASPLLATLKDAGGNPVSGATVTFTAPASGASGTFAGGLKANTTVTNASGLATSATFTANRTAGSYRVTATAGALEPANFSLTNTPVSPPPSAPVFSAPMNFDTNGIAPNCVQAADLNGDGKIDLVITNMKTNNVSVLLGNGDGTFQPAVTYGLASGGLSFPGCAAVADFNNDGNPDIAVTDGLVGTSGGTISILINKGNGTFFPAYAVNSNISPLCLVAADLNKDGNQDLWVGGNGGSAVLFGKGDGTFQAPQIYSIGLADTAAVAVGDLNGDGLLDLVGVAVTGGSPVKSVLGVLLNQGNGIFGPTSSGNAATLLNPVGSLGAGVVLGDLNHDGKLDTAVTNFGSYSISILLGNGNGTFQPQSTFIAGNGPASLALADFDGTGRMDLVFTTQDAAMNGEGVIVYLGNGDGTFSFYQGLATGSSPASLTVGDFNNDGVPDIAVVDSSSNVVSIILTHR